MSKKSKNTKPEALSSITSGMEVVERLTYNDSDIVFDCGLRTASGVCYDDMSPGAILTVEIQIDAKLGLSYEVSGTEHEVRHTYIRKGILLIGPRASLPSKWYEPGSRVSQGDTTQKDVDKFNEAIITILPLVDRPVYDPQASLELLQVQYCGLPLQIRVKDVKSVIGHLNGNLTKGRSKGVPFQMGIKAPLLDSI